MIPDEAAKSVRQLTLRVKELEAHIARTRSALICAFNQMLDLKDLNTGCHSTRLAEWGVRVARDLGADESSLHDIETAALLHDIGKVGIPDAILHKAQQLNEDEWMLMKKHPEYGWAIVRMLPDFERASLFVLHHHRHTTTITTAGANIQGY
jgi:HD-GYP domain-containing protein (c-di-GMP phosphodiesterase class II)